MRLTRLFLTLALAFGLLALTAPAALAKSHDRNHDGLPDRWERHYHLSLHVNQARRDEDRDGLVNKAEFRADTNPRDADTDNDGTDDGEEHAGTVASFDPSTGELVI